MNKLTWIICISAMLWLLLWTSGALADEWLACDVPDVTENVTEYAIIVDAQPEQIVPINIVGSDVLLLDITALDAAAITVQAINSQGRRSDPTPFNLLPAPSALSGMRIIEE